MVWHRSKRRRKLVLALIGPWLGLSPELVEEALELAAGEGYASSKSEDGKRLLATPVGLLYTAQVAILDSLLRTVPISAAAHGGVPGRSTLTHARVHLPGARHLLTLDIHRAYPSIRRPVVAGALRRALGGMLREEGLEARLRRDVCDALARITTTADGLPTGAPTSTTLFNLAAAPFDEAAEKLAAERLGARGRYSRYLDDMAFSSAGPLPTELPELVARALKVHDLGALNVAKTRRQDATTGPMEITGIRAEGLGYGLDPGRLAKLAAALEECLEAARSGDGRAARARASGIRRYLQSIYGAARVPAQHASLVRRVEAAAAEGTS